MAHACGGGTRFRWAVAALVAAGALMAPRASNAQQQTFHLDRLEVPGAPDDGLVLFRPVTNERAIVYGQLGLGLSLDSLRTSDITNDAVALRNSKANVVTSQFSTYFSGGFELLDRLTLGFTLPIAWEEAGHFPNYSSGTFSSSSFTVFDPTGPAVGDMRFDLRYVFFRADDRSWALGGQVGVFVPTGGGSTTNFGGDGKNLTAWPAISGEWTPKHFLTLVANTGVDFRSDNSINDPTGTLTGHPNNGLGIGWEWRWAAGAFLPIKQGKYRIGGTIFGQTGITNDSTTGPTAFTRRNTPIEWDVEGRMRLPTIAGNEHFYVGVGGGSLIAPGYGAPDFRLVALLGTYFTIDDTNASSPDNRARIRASIHAGNKDTDGDGIPDDIDACPTEPEDHKDPDPNDGCPAPSDRDGDGIPDAYDKCPDVPEDKDGIDDQDGCPEDDADGDGIPDVKDACPKVPGQPDPDPKKNGCPKFISLEGSTVRVLQQVHFATASATILPDSFPMLTEIVQLLKANGTIKKMMIEGHTDNRGAAEMNLDLSKRRAASVKSWLVQHGIEPGRLDSEGYGMTRPIQTNDTNEGRQGNRRVEFKITAEDTSNGPPPPTKTLP
jgi:outer membrane protein OmpA-like peptidoglycan-associated protein